MYITKIIFICLLSTTGKKFQFYSNLKIFMTNQYLFSRIPSILDILIYFLCGVQESFFHIFSTGKKTKHACLENIQTLWVMTCPCSLQTSDVWIQIQGYFNCIQIWTSKKLNPDSDFCLWITTLFKIFYYGPN